MILHYTASAQWASSLFTQFALLAVCGVGQSRPRHKPNGLFNEATTFGSRPGVEVLFSSEEVFNESSSPGLKGLHKLGTVQNLTELCADLEGGIQLFCKETLPGVFDHFATLPLASTPIPGRPRRAEICHMAAGKIPSFCRLDSRSFHSCSVRTRVIAIDDVFVDTGNMGARATGSIFTADGSVFPVDPYTHKWAKSLPMVKPAIAQNLLNAAAADQNQPSDIEVVELNELVYGLSTYSGVFFHSWREVMAYMMLAIEHAPENAPILIAPGTTQIDTFLREAFAIGYPPDADCTKPRLKHTAKCNKRSDDAALAITERLLPLRHGRGTLLKVKRLYIPWIESKAAGSTANEWTSIAVENKCSWATALPAIKLRQELWRWIDQPLEPVDEPTTTMRQHGHPKTNASAPSELRQILIVHRAEVIRRQVKNHGEMLQAVKVAFPGHLVVEFIGKNFTIQESFEQFRRSDVVVAAHGAALTFALTMKPGSSLVELLFKDTRRNSHMSYDMYRGTAHQLGVNYALSICHGSFESSLKANISDVVRLVGELEAAANVKLRGGLSGLSGSDNEREIVSTIEEG
jgi:hypothetical protein